MPLISAFRRQRQADLCEFEASLVYRASSRTARDTQRNPASKKRKRNKERKKERKREEGKEGEREGNIIQRQEELD